MMPGKPMHPRMQRLTDNLIAATADLDVIDSMPKPQQKKLAIFTMKESYLAGEIGLDELLKRAAIADLNVAIQHLRHADLIEVLPGNQIKAADKVRRTEALDAQLARDLNNQGRLVENARRYHKYGELDLRDQVLAMLEARWPDVANEVLDELVQVEPGWGRSEYYTDE